MLRFTRLAKVTVSKPSLIVVQQLGVTVAMIAAKYTR